MRNKSNFGDGPVRHPGLAHDIPHRDRTEHPRIRRVAAVIAKDIHVALRNDHIAIIGPGSTSRAILNVIFGQELSVDEDVAITKGHFFAGQPYDPLDVGLVRAGRWIEDDDVTALRRIEWVIPVAADV